MKFVSSLSLQTKAARGLLCWSVDDLASHANISPTEVEMIEDGRTPFDKTDLVRGALERAGVVFINASEEGGVGVRLRHRRPFD
jgi:ribosome-binding protein aMBF1 (putative translation factor)